MRSKIANFFGSVLFRLALVFGALAATTGFTIAIGWGVFQSAATGLTTLSSDSLPELRKSAEIVALTDEVRGNLAEILIAGDLTQLNARYATTAEILDRARRVVATLPGAKAAELGALVEGTQDALDLLIAARADEFRSETRIAGALEEASALKRQTSAALAAVTDRAFAELVRGGEATIASLDGTLTSLVEGHFARLQAMLEIRSEVNLLSGLAISATQTRDGAVRTMLRDLGTAAGNRLDRLLPPLADDPATAGLAGTVADARARFAAALRGSGDPIAILSARQEVDAALVTALDDLVFETVIESEDAKTANAGAIDSLLTGQVTAIRTLAALDAANKSFFAALVDAAVSTAPADLDAREMILVLEGGALQAQLADLDADLQETLNALIALSAEEGGIVTLRREGLKARQQAGAAARLAADSVGDISAAVSAFSDAVRRNIDATASNLAARVQEATADFGRIAYISAALVTAALLAVWATVIRPLNRITRTTERLAAGNLDPIRSIGRAGEIGRLARALQVFRTGALDQIRLQAEKEKTEAAAREAERAAEEERRATEERERQLAIAVKTREREREKAELARQEAARAEADAERQARAAEQDTVVRELAAGLQRLAEGDLTYRIDTRFAGDYDALRCNYNEAIDTLASLVGQIAGSASEIDASSNEIAAASKDLARRTEGSAASLEEAAAALNVLTSSVSAAAKGASEADRTVRNTRADAESSRSVMQEAIQAMSEIEAFSAKITKITDVIDDLSFQTNLLALNAGVEAARAGEAGRGFAVVASEVRALAQRSSDAAQEISQLIAGSTSKIGEGAARVDQAGTALEAVIAAITEISTHVAQIAESADEQSSGIAEINATIGSLDRATQQNVAVFEETTAASQFLTREAGALAGVVRRFRTGGDMPHEVAGPEAA